MSPKFDRRGVNFARISRWETLSHLALIIISTVYAAIKLHQASLVNWTLLKSEYFTGAWIPGYERKDNSDFEWGFWVSICPYIIPMFISHSLISYNTRQHLPQFWYHVLLIHSITCCIVMIGFNGTMFLLSHTILHYIITTTTKNKQVCWIQPVLSIIVINFKIININMVLCGDETHTQKLVFMFTMSLSVLRLISFSMDYCSSTVNNRSVRTQYTLIQMLSYVFYLPLLFNGPMICYDKFISHTSSLRAMSCCWKRIIFDMISCLFWGFVIEVTLHHLYFIAMQKKHIILTTLPLWELAACGYFSIHFMQMKYIIFYRFPSAFARIDGLDPPLQPRCIARVFLFTDLWRTFDRGLYTWMMRYIYIPLGGSRQGTLRQLMASLSAFIVIAVWHGSSFNLIVWAMINWTGLVSEAIGKSIIHNDTIYRMIMKYEKCTWSRRLIVLILTVPLAVMITANLIFLSGTDSTLVYVKRIVINGWPLSTAIMVGLLYSAVQIALDISHIDVIYDTTIYKSII